MSDRARLVLTAIDAAEQTRAHHPTLFAAQLRNDRTCLQLARAVEHYKREKPTPKMRPDRDRQVERVDSAIEDAFAVRRQERFAKDRIRREAQRRERRAALSVLELHQQALHRAVTISTVPAANIEPTRASGNTPDGVPIQQMLDDDLRWQVSWRIVRRQLLAVHEIIDEAEGIGRGAAIAGLDGVDKDRAIVQEGIGLIAEDVVAALGREYGSASYVRRLRKERGLDTRGYERQEI